MKKEKLKFTPANITFESYSRGWKLIQVHLNKPTKPIHVWRIIWGLDLFIEKIPVFKLGLAMWGIVKLYTIYIN